MEDVEALALEDPLHPRHRLRRQDDVRERGVGGRDHGPPHGEDVVGELPVAARSRVQQMRQAPRRVVPDDDLHLVAERLERLGLVLGVLDDSAQ